MLLFNVHELTSSVPATTVLRTYTSSAIRWRGRGVTEHAPIDAGQRRSKSR